MNRAEQKRALLELAKQYTPSKHELEFNAAGQPLDSGPTEEDIAQMDFEDLKDIQHRDQQIGKPLRVRYFEGLKSKLNPS